MIKFEDLIPKTKPVFIPGLTPIELLFEEQYQTISKRMLETAIACWESKEVDLRQHCIFGKPGIGKTTTLVIDSLWRIIHKGVTQYGKQNQVHILVAPDKGLVEEVEEQLKEMAKTKFKLLQENGIELQDVYNDPLDVKGERRIEILVCTIQMLLDEPKYFEHIKNIEITAIYTDEAHLSLGSPGEDPDTYRLDVGHNGTDYEAKRFRKIRDELNYRMWFSFTGTPTYSQRNDKKNYNVISDTDYTAERRLPFMDKKIHLFPNTPKNYNTLPLLGEKLYNPLEETFKNVTQKNAIGKHLKSKIEKKNIDSIPELGQTKVTALIKAGRDNSLKYLNTKEVKDEWERLTEEYKDKTFEYEGIELPYSDGLGKIKVLTSKIKEDGNNKDTFDKLNDENDDTVAVVVIEIGKVGVNIKNLSTLCFLTVVENDGSVDTGPTQVIGRLNRTKIGDWPTFTYHVANINNYEQRKLMIKLAINTHQRSCFAISGGLVSGAYDSAIEGNIKSEDAEGHLQAWVNMIREHGGKSSISGKERDLTYKNERKNRCEYPGCTCYEDLVLNADDELTKSEREINYIRSLQVDHIDGDRENMNPDNLWTLCPNRHSMKTMQNQDYLNNYVDND